MQLGFKGLASGYLFGAPGNGRQSFALGQTNSEWIKKGDAAYQEYDKLYWKIPAIPDFAGQLALVKWLASAYPGGAPPAFYALPSVTPLTLAAQPVPTYNYGSPEHIRWQVYNDVYNIGPAAYATQGPRDRLDLFKEIIGVFKGKLATALPKLPTPGPAPISPLTTTPLTSALTPALAPAPAPTGAPYYGFFPVAAQTAPTTPPETAAVQATPEAASGLLNVFLPVAGATLLLAAFM